MSRVDLAERFTATYRAGHAVTALARKAKSQLVRVCAVHSNGPALLFQNEKPRQDHLTGFRL